MRSRAVLGGPLLVASVLLAGCAAPGSPGASGGAASSGRAGPVHLTVLAAASLAKAVTDAAGAYDAAHPGTTIAVSSGSSAALRVQIEQGAPADLLLSADVANAQALVDEGMGDGPVVPVARNHLTVIVAPGTAARIASPADLARAGVRIAAAASAVPITAYATRVVVALARLAGYPADFAARYAANVVSREDDVTAVVAKVQLGEADAAIVYATDAAGANVRTVPIPAAANVDARETGVVVRSSQQRDAAHAFLAWLAGPAGAAILERRGFLAP